MKKTDPFSRSALKWSMKSYLTIFGNNRIMSRYLCSGDPINMQKKKYRLNLNKSKYLCLSVVKTSRQKINLLVVISQSTNTFKTKKRMNKPSFHITDVSWFKFFSWRGIRKVCFIMLC